MLSSEASKAKFRGRARVTTLNVWQTLDLLAGNDLRKRVEGFEDIHSWLKGANKRGSYTDEMLLGENSIDETTGYGGSETYFGTSSTAKSNETASKTICDQTKGQKKAKKKVKAVPKKKKKPNKDKLPKDYGIIVDCSFNLPRISARLERLMGTNVVRLTDRKYMNELRQKIQEDYNITLQKRIELREEQEKERQKQLLLNGKYKPEVCPPALLPLHSIVLTKELERERRMIMEGKGEKVPEELSNHPVFIIHQDTNSIIAKRRSKLKTNREKNAERLVRQGAKWERERLVYDEIEKQKEIEVSERKEQQVQIEEEYKEENSVRGMDLLRIENDAWKDCELNLRKFLDEQKQEIEQHFTKDSEPFTSDPLDVANIVKARRQFRDTERKIRQQLDEQIKADSQISTREFLAQSSACSIASRKRAELELLDPEIRKFAENILDPNLEKIIEEDDVPSNGSNAEICSVSPSESEFLKELEKDLEDDEKNERIVTKSKMQLLQYEDPKVLELKHTENVKDLYKLAEEIIIGDAQVVRTA